MQHLNGLDLSPHAVPRTLRQNTPLPAGENSLRFDDFFSLPADPVYSPVVPELEAPAAAVGEYSSGTASPDDRYPAYDSDLRTDAFKTESDSPRTRGKDDPAVPENRDPQGSGSETGDTAASAREKAGGLSADEASKQNGDARRTGNGRRVGAAGSDRPSRTDSAVEFNANADDLRSAAGRNRDRSSAAEKSDGKSRLNAAGNKQKAAGQAPGLGNDGGAADTHTPPVEKLSGREALGKTRPDSRETSGLHGEKDVRTASAKVGHPQPTLDGTKSGERMGDAAVNGVDSENDRISSEKAGSRRNVAEKYGPAHREGSAGSADAARSGMPLAGKVGEAGAATPNPAAPDDAAGDSRVLGSMTSEAAVAEARTDAGSGDAGGDSGDRNDGGTFSNLMFRNSLSSPSPSFGQDIQVFLVPEGAGIAAGNAASGAGAGTSAARAMSAEELVEAFRQQMKGQLGSDIVRQARFVLRGQNSGEISLILKPENLGRVRIRMNLEDKSIDGRIFVENETVKEAFSQALDDLREAFLDQGFEDLNLDISLDDGADGRDTDSGEPEKVIGRSAGAKDLSDRRESVVAAAQAYVKEYRDVNLFA
jgi:hypothetical protein